VDPDQTRAAQAESWATVAEALAGVPALIAVTDGPEHKLVYTNDAYLEVFGSGSGTTEPPLTAEASLSALDSVYRTGRPHSVRAVPVSLVATDGRSRRGFFTFVYLPLRDTERRLSGVLVVAADVTPELRGTERHIDSAPRLQSGGPRSALHQPDELQVAARSRPGADATGAWHDVVPLGAGRTAIIIGDVREHDSGAATVVNTLRAAVRAYARLDLPPVEILRLLDDLVADEPHSTSVTCGYAVFDPAENTLSYASAGHLPPLLLHPDGDPAPPMDDRGAPLGAHRGTFAQDVWPLHEGTVVALYTAGLVPGANGAGAAALVTALGEEPGSLQERCDAVLENLAGSDGAMLVMIGRRDPGAGRLPRSIELALSEGREPARRARAFCHGVLSTWQVPEHKREDIVLVVSELVTNAILHGGAAEQLRLRRTPRRVVIEVFDHGPRMPHPRAADLKAESGRGLHLVARLADRWGARPVRGGKAVWCEFDTPVPDVSPARRGGGEVQALSG
jgi:anti-sigma regulatory factor (Ser/Thr protein kinase)